MLDPGIAFRAAIHAMTSGGFTARKLSDFVTAEKADYRNARRVISGQLDNADKIAAEAVKFEQMLTASVTAGSATAGCKPPPSRSSAGWWPWRMDGGRDREADGGQDRANSAAPPA